MSLSQLSKKLITLQIKLMKTQKLSLTVALGLSAFSCLVGAPMRANAGGVIVPGPPPGPFNPLIPRLERVVRTINRNSLRFSNNILNVAPETQNDLNVAANDILQEYQDVNMLFAVIQNKSLVENGESPIVDINMLNAAIVDYNDLLMQSSPEELRELAQDPEFIRTGRMLKELRAVLSRN